MTESPETREDALTPIEQEAHAWIRRMVSGEASTADATALRRWCGLSSAHAAAFSEASQFWEAFGASGQMLREQDEARRPNRRVMSRRVVIGSAMAATAAGVMIVRPPLDLWPSFSEMRADYRTGPGEQRGISVADGVSIRLNTRTSLSVRPGGDSGAVKLVSGEASFKTPDDLARPFSVLASGGTTSATNARFNIRVTESNICIVTCLTDRVEVAHRGRTVSLDPEQQVNYGDDGIGRVIGIDPSVVLAWQQGLLIFRMTPLVHVIQELNRYRPGRIVLLNAGLERSPVNGRFRIDRPDEALVQIERAFGVHRRSLPGGLVLLT